MIKQNYTQKWKVMEVINRNKNRPRLKIKKFSTLYIELFEQILYSGKTNWYINQAYGYSKKSHCVVDHSRKVMFKLLALENLSKEKYKEQVVYPRTYHLWWKRLLNKHKVSLINKAVKPEYYDDIELLIRQDAEAHITRMVAIRWSSW